MELDFWTFVAAILIFSLGAGFSLYEGVSKLASPHAIQKRIVNYIVLAFAIIFEGAACAVAFKEFRKTKGSSAISRPHSATRIPLCSPYCLKTVPQC